MHCSCFSYVHICMKPEVIDHYGYSAGECSTNNFFVKEDTTALSNKNILAKSLNWPLLRVSWYQK